ncbi:MAG: hypothetical protein JW795_11390 [Chitinivibrionales bacterium]|nr:hypothetical protein [Chitinivibrionales bacterium]
MDLDRLAMVRMQIGDIRVLWSQDERITRQFTSIDSVYHEVSKLILSIRWLCGKNSQLQLGIIDQLVFRFPS